jgi:hypothetical protein
MNDHREASRGRTLMMSSEASRTETEYEATKSALPNKQSIRPGTLPIRRDHNVSFAAYETGGRSTIRER